MSCSASHQTPPPVPPVPQMKEVHVAKPDHWWEKVTTALEELFSSLGGDSLLDSMKNHELDQWLGQKFPIHLKEHVYLILVSTAVTGALVGYLIFYFFFNNRNNENDMKGPWATKESRRLSKGASSPMEEEDEKMPELESDDENTPLRILQGRFNREVISNLHKFNKENGELIRLGDLESDKSDASDEDEDEVETPTGSSNEIVEIEELEEEGSTGNVDGKVEGEEKENTAMTKEEIMMEKLGTLHGKLATAQIRQESIKMKKKMSKNERDEEARIRDQQLEAIMALMKADKDKFGENSEELLLDQMESLYNI